MGMPELSFPDSSGSSRRGTPVLTLRPRRSGGLGANIAFPPLQDNADFILLPRAVSTTEIDYEHYNTYESRDDHFSSEEKEQSNSQSQHSMDGISFTTPKSPENGYLMPLLCPSSPTTPELYGVDHNSAFVITDYCPGKFPLDLNRARSDTEDDLSDDECCSLHRVHSMRELHANLGFGQQNYEHLNLSEIYNEDDSNKMRRTASAPALCPIGFEFQKDKRSSSGCFVGNFKGLQMLHHGVKEWFERVVHRWIPR